MQAYQFGNAKFSQMDTEVFGITTDNTPSLKRWAEDLKLGFPLVSDFMRKVSAEYGVLMPERGMASRATFVIDKEGRIQHIEQGSGAIDISGAETACSRLHHNK